MTGREEAEVKGVVGREELPLAVEGREFEGEETAFAIASIVREREED